MGKFWNVLNLILLITKEVKIYQKNRVPALSEPQPVSHKYCGEKSRSAWVSPVLWGSSFVLGPLAFGSPHFLRHISLTLSSSFSLTP